MDGKLEEILWSAGKVQLKTGIKDLKKIRRPQLLTLARILNLPVKKSGKGNQPLLSDVWNTLFPVWKSGNKNRSKYKSRQETYHDQNIITTGPPNTSHNVTTNTNISKRTRSFTDTELLKTPRHPPRKKDRKSCSQSSSNKKSNKNDGSQSHKKRKSNSSTSRGVKRLQFTDYTQHKPPKLRNYGNTCYINAGLQALAGSSNIGQLISRIYVQLGLV